MTLLFKYSGMAKIPDLILRKSVGTCSSSNGSVPHSRAYKITPVMIHESQWEREIQFVLLHGKLMSLLVLTT